MTEGAEVLAPPPADPAPPAGDGTPPPTGEPPPPWYNDVTGELRDWTELKGWKSPADALNSARNLEKMIGADKAGRTVMIPKEGEPWDDVYAKLGRPETKDDYKLSGEGERAEWFKTVAHENGLSQAQADKLFTEIDSVDKAASEAREQQQAEKSKVELDELRKEWGLAYDQHVRAGQQAASKFGFTAEELGAMEDALGTKNLLMRMAAIGKAVGEHGFESGDSNDPGFGLTPAAAQAKITELKSDPEFTKAYMDPSHINHKAMLDKMQRLMASAYPE